MSAGDFMDSILTAKSNLDLWKESFNANCLLGWNGKPKMILGAIRFDDFFTYTNLRWMLNKSTTIEDALSNTPNITGVKLEHSGKIGDTNQIPYTD